MPTLGRGLGPWEMTPLPCPGLLPIASENQIGGGPKPHPDVGPDGRATWAEKVLDGVPQPSARPEPDAVRSGLPSPQTTLMARGARATGSFWPTTVTCPQPF